jgi:Na+-translocating ferredoxin:NAD+ oxidoreductase subunit D
MLWVIAACVPALLVSTWFFGIGAALNIAMASGFALVFEAIALMMRGRNWRFAIRDNSALVTAVLLGIALPPGTHWWLVLTGSAFSILLAKQAFGGLGQNLFNPAMCGYAMLLLSFPLEMTSWHIPVTSISAGTVLGPLGINGLQESLGASLPFLAAGPVSEISEIIDGMATATPLIEQKLAARNAIVTALNSNTNIFSRSAGTGWELVNIGFLLGGVLLLLRRIITWHIPFSIIATIALLSLLFYSESSASVVGTPYLHLFGSATMIGAFLIATDPVSSASTPLGKIIYGIIIGFAIYSIRIWGSYLDSIAFAVLFGNLCAPLIDELTMPRIYGHPRRFQLWKS